MDPLNLNDIWAGVAWVAAAIVLLANAAEKIAKTVQTAKAPNAKQDERLEKLEGRMTKVENKLTSDHDRFKSLDDGNRITQRALLALLGHGLNGNNIDEMQHAKDELQNYLIDR